jgi:hypothetical protein
MGPRAKKVLVWAAIIFVVMGIIKQPEQSAQTTNKGIDAIETGANNGGTFITSVLNGQFGQ